MPESSYVVTYGSAQEVRTQLVIPEKQHWDAVKSVISRVLIARRFGLPLPTFGLYGIVISELAPV